MDNLYHAIRLNHANVEDIQPSLRVPLAVSARGIKLDKLADELADREQGRERMKRS